MSIGGDPIAGPWKIVKRWPSGATPSISPQCAAVRTTVGATSTPVQALRLPLESLVFCPTKTTYDRVGSDVPPIIALADGTTVSRRAAQREMIRSRRAAIGTLCPKSVAAAMPLWSDQTPSTSLLRG